MERIDSVQLKKIEFDILKYFKKICIENQLQYFLCGGTLLGAIRHKGFIPWDDDIDVFMPRADYEKLLQVMKKKEEEKYQLYEHTYYKNYLYPFAKLCDTNTVLIEEYNFGMEIGVYIDIFPIDNIPDNDILYKKLYKKYSKLHFLLVTATDRHPWKSHKWYKCIPKGLLHYILQLYGASKITKKMIENAKLYNNIDTGFCGGVVWGYGLRERMSKKCFEKAVPVEFEKEIFDAPAGYEIYLKQIYNDYMQWPPEDKRISNHCFKAYYKNRGLKDA